MKKLFFALILIPVFCYAQHFEVSEIIGYSNCISSPSNFNINPGISNQLSFNYYPIKHFSFGAVYEFDNWNAVNNSFGLNVDFHSKYFYFGIFLSEMSLSPTTSLFARTENEDHNYDPAFCYGLHIGTKQKLFKRLFLKEQLLFNMAAITDVYTIHDVVLNSEYTYHISSDLYYYSILVGLSYRF